MEINFSVIKTLPMLCGASTLMLLKVISEKHFPKCNYIFRRISSAGKKWERHTGKEREHCFLHVHHITYLYIVRRGGLYNEILWTAAAVRRTHSKFVYIYISTNLENIAKLAGVECQSIYTESFIEHLNVLTLLEHASETVS